MVKAQRRKKLLSKVAKSPKPNGAGKISHAEQLAIGIVVKRHLEVFKELERY